MSISFWERSRVLPQQDLIVIGAGITGIQAAIAAKKKHTDWKVAVLERGPFLAGASTKNAGFACIGSLSEIAEDIAAMGEAQTFSLMERRYRGLKYLREQVGDRHLAYLPLGGYELFRPDDHQNYQAASEVVSLANAAIQQFSGTSTAFEKADRHRQFSGVSHSWFTGLEGQLDPFRMMSSLHEQATALGIRIMHGYEVLRIEPSGRRVLLQTRLSGELQAGQVIVATNGFARKLLPSLAVRPVRNQVVVTTEVPDLLWAGTHHYDRGYVYFRNIGKRVLLGGFRNLGGDAEETDTFGLTDVLQEQLESFLREVVLPGRAVEITHRWSGILGVGASKEPIIEEVQPGIFVAVRLGGMGVALGSLLGQEVASKL